MKVKLFDINLRRKFYGILTGISLFLSLLLIFVEIPLRLKSVLGIFTLILICILYLFMWKRANKQLSVEFHIDNSPIEVKFGNIFDEDGLKVIAFNEYFDTLVDDKIIAHRTLNGYFINNYIPDITILDNGIVSDERLKELRISTNTFRLHGKKEKYKLGSIYKYDDFLLTAFSHFDKDNRAYLSMQDYIGFLISFWNEIDIVYAGKTVVIPLLGSGITRFKSYENISDEELLRLLLWSFKISRIRFQYPAKVKFIIGEDKKDKISLYELPFIYSN